jgi:16S rRNA processing protein RimM
VQPEKKKESPLGSNSSTEPSRVRVGRLGKPNGLDGYIGLYADTPDLVHFEPGSKVFVDDTPHVVGSLRQGKKGAQVLFEGISTRAEAESIRGAQVYVAERRQLDEGEYWPGDLIGLEVRPGGGEVVDVAHGPAQDRLVVLREGARFEIPFVAALVPVVDVAAGYVEIVEIDGLS